MPEVGRYNLFVSERMNAGHGEYEKRNEKR